MILVIYPMRFEHDDCSKLELKHPGQGQPNCKGNLTLPTITRDGHSRVVRSVARGRRPLCRMLDFEMSNCWTAMTI